MKAWFVTLRGLEENLVGDLVFAETRGQAKVRVMELDRSNFTELRVRREPRFDGDPREVTSLECVEVGYGVECDGPDCSRRVYAVGDGAGHADERGRVYCPECWCSMKQP